ncbi:MAG: NADH:flavin oxidoreductase [Proteobacteria bacterium]|nr:NADH:flavin oxidoreductase [Pseudomonadota bacterium]
MSSNESDSDESPTHDDVDVIFRPLTLSAQLRVKNRLLRSNLAGKFDDYNGFGGNARLNWEEQFARGGVGAIISSYVPITVRGRILTSYATIDDDDKIPFWTEVGRRVHKYDCRYIVQLSHSGRQRDQPGIENLYNKAASSTDRRDFFHGILCYAMSKEEIGEIVELFADGAERVKKAGLDGVELHGANGYLITQFLSSGINDRRDEYGGSVENRARFALDIVRAIRARVGRDFHLQMKINAVDHNRWLFPFRRPWEGKGNTLQETLEICRILEDGGDGVDAFHISSGSTFPHPRNPPGDMPVKEASRAYGTMLPSGVSTHGNYRIFRSRSLGWLFRKWWLWHRGSIVEGINAEYARQIKKHVSVPVLCTGGWQSRPAIAEAIRSGACDAVTIARPMILNKDLAEILKRQERPDVECTYCNKCLVNAVANPLGCYDESRFEGKTFEDRRHNMLAEIMSVFSPPSYSEEAAKSHE